MLIKVKPIIVLGRGESWVCRLDGFMEVIPQGETLQLKVAQFSKDLRDKLRYADCLLADSIVRNESEIQMLQRQRTEADALLVCVFGPMPLQTLFQWGLPIIAFSGQHTPMMALYAFGAERHSRTGITIALDYQEVDEAIHLLDARKRLTNTRIALFGFPPALFSRWHHLPDLEFMGEKLGIQFTPVELREFAARLPMADEAKAQALAEQWLQEASGVVEPSKSDVTDVARLYLVMSDMLEEKKANALAMNCFELRTLKAPAPCYAMARLRDKGIHAACEGDVSALLTMMLLGYLADKPAFMGNVVHSDPVTNTVMISHCLVPTRMAGYDQQPRHYVLRNYHGSRGVTAHVELDIGQEVTVARMSRNADRIMLLRGELVECTDTTSCRTTLSIRVSDVRKFIGCAFGNHHIVVYGDYIRHTKALSRALDIGIFEL